MGSQVIFIGQPGPVGPTGPGYAATSTTSITVGTGSKSFTTQTGLAYSISSRARATSITSGAYLEGEVTSYSSTTLAINVDSTSGSGSHTDWAISLIGEHGTSGSAATIAAGTITTLSPGSSATVTNSGSSSAAVFNFGIPMGTGLNFRGAYSGGTTYAQGDSASDGGHLYASLQSSNTGNTPASSPTFWQDLGIAGLGDPGSNGIVKRTAVNTTSIATGADLPVFVASGGSHSGGAVPDPGASAGSSRFLREDATFAIPPGTSLVPLPWSQTPGGSLTVGSNVITLTMPAGVTLASVGTFVYISNGSGTAEAVQITGWSSTAIAVTCVNSHSGAWTVGSASGGIQEIVTLGGSSGSVIQLPPGIIAIYAPIRCSYPVTILGSGMRITELRAQGNVGIFNVIASYFTAKDLFLNATAQQASGYGFLLGAGGGNDSQFDRFENVMFNLLYVCIQALSASNWSVTNCVFYNFTSVGIIADDQTNPDWDGPVIQGCTCYVSGLSTPAYAFLLIGHSGSVTVSNCPSIQGGGIGQLERGICWSNSPSSGLTVTANYFQDLDVAAIEIDGSCQNIAITGNHYVQPSGGVGTFVSLAGNSGGGILWGTITGNDVVGPGGSTAFFFVTTSNSVDQIYIGGNNISNCFYGFYLNHSSGGITIGPNNIWNVANPAVPGLSGVASTLYINPGFSPNYVDLPLCRVGSQMYCADANLAGTSGGSNGQMVFRINSGSPTWVH